MITEVEAFLVDNMMAKADILKALEAKGVSKREFDKMAEKGEARCTRYKRFVFPIDSFSELGEPIEETIIPSSGSGLYSEESIRYIYRCNIFPMVNLSAIRLQDGHHWNVRFCKRVGQNAPLRQGFQPLEWTADELKLRFPNQKEIDGWDCTTWIQFPFTLNGCQMNLVGQFDFDLLQSWEMR